MDIIGRNHLFLQGEGAGAVEDYRKSLELEPDNAASWFNLALALEGSRDMEGALPARKKETDLGMA